MDQEVPNWDFGNAIEEIEKSQIELAIAEIRRIASEWKTVSVSALSGNTELSKGFFYKNEQVRDVLNEERERQDQGKLAQIKNERYGIKA